ncbi:metallophosphoesterase family protein [Streptomyces sp. NPDC003023]|uniref:metallophosphoesterase family protein n=1 Tax=Streptomyces sp. NPDC003023 TaxID=3364675 RepID=UPI0036AF1A5E
MAALSLALVAGVAVIGSIDEDPVPGFEKAALTVTDVPAEQAAKSEYVVAVAGDICDSSKECLLTDPLVDNMNPDAVIGLGDQAYSSGTITEHNSYYDPYWGKYTDKTNPVPGNHEYLTAGASGYYDYFGARAGERGKGYYSFDVGDWHFIALNSSIDMSVGSAQHTWLKADLAANSKSCTGAFLHHPLVSVGRYSGFSSTKPAWDELYGHGADLVLVGHDHSYQRYAKINPSKVKDPKGIREILVGTGGRGYYAAEGTHSALEAKNDNTFGVLKLRLTSSTYKWDFLPVEGSTFTDSGTARCNNAKAISIDPGSVILPKGTSKSVKISVSKEFAGSTELSVSGLPVGVTGSITPNPVTTSSTQDTVSATLTLTADSLATSGSATAIVTGTSSTLTEKATFGVRVEDQVYTDDFETSTGWTINATGTDTATVGKWQRGDPLATSHRGTKQIGTATSGLNALVTDRRSGVPSTGTTGATYDVDGGTTSIRSPEIALPSSGALNLSLNYNFAHYSTNASADDHFRLRIIGATGTVTVLDKTGTPSTNRRGEWRQATADVSQFAGQRIRILIEAVDAAGATIVEAAVDDVKITRT